MKLIKLTAVLAMTAIAGSAQASLFDRGGGLIYDDTLNITWLSDANYAKTSGYDADGRMNWSTANAWATGLSYGGYDDWRLPSALNRDGTGPCWGGCPFSGEMSHMFYINWVAAYGEPMSDGDNAAAARKLFTNVMNYEYWLGTVSLREPGVSWLFQTHSGHQGYTLQGSESYAWAVRDGDVTVSPVPVPRAFILMLSGLGLIGGIARRRKQTPNA
jgi:hypothetical protein